MKIVYKKTAYNENLYNETIKKVEEYSFIDLSYKEIFDEMKHILAKALDAYNWRENCKFELDFEDCYIGIIEEKDCNGYPVIVLGMDICDWEPEGSCKEIQLRPHYQLKLTPFNCYLEKTNALTCHGAPPNDCSAYDKELTTFWRTILKEKFPVWEPAFKQYIENIRDLKTNKAQRDIERANKEYQEELDSINL